MGRYGAKVDLLKFFAENRTQQSAIQVISIPRNMSEMRRVSLLLIEILIFTFLFIACSKTLEVLNAAQLLDLGEKYLLEMNCEQAVVYFTQTIEIEPMNPRGYTGMAEAYVALSKTDKALEKGYDVLDHSVFVDTSALGMMSNIFRKVDLCSL